MKHNPDWQFEATVFGVVMPTALGACPAETMPVYRLYNNGQGGAPNHRYVGSVLVRQQMLGRGWVPEGLGAIGVIACVPLH